VVDKKLLCKKFQIKKKIKIMFDSDILNKIVEGELNINEFLNDKNFEFYATHIQLKQIARCKNKEKKAKLMSSFFKINPIIIPTESAVFDISQFDYAKYSNGNTLEELKKNNKKHTEDALIGETTLKNNIILVTNDKTLQSRLNKQGRQAINLEEFKKLIKNG